MQLVVDVGNTETVVGLATSPTEIASDWRVSSSVPRTGDEMTALIRAFLAGDGVDEGAIVRGVVGLQGNLAPDGAIVKVAGMSAEEQVFTGPARVFECEEDARTPGGPHE